MLALVVDRRSWVLTHLGVEPWHRHHGARLVPIGRAEADPGGDVHLRCDRATFLGFPELEEVELVDGSGYESLEFDRFGYRGYEGMGGYEPIAVWTDAVPKGEQALRGHTPIQVGERELGHFDGLLVEADGRIRALLVARGHLWTRRTIVVPMPAVTSVNAGLVTVADTWDHKRRPS